MPRILAAALTAAALLWATFILAAPSLLAGRSRMAVVTAVVYTGAAAFCHQRSERSFHSAGRQMPVCARCSGLYLSGAAGAAAAWLARRRSRLTPRAIRILLVVCAAPTALTWLLEHGGVADVSNAGRALAALPLGAAAGWTFVRLLRAEA